MNEEKAKQILTPLVTQVNWTNKIEFKKNIELVEFLRTFKWATSFQEGAYLIMNEVTDEPICIECKTRTKFVNFSSGYRKFCSCRCRAINNQSFKNAHSEESKKKITLKNRSKTKEEREESNKKRKETIVKNFGSLDNYYETIKTKITNKNGGFYTAQLNKPNIYKLFWENKDEFVKVMNEYPSLTAIDVEFGFLPGDAVKLKNRHNIQIKIKRPRTSLAENEIKSFIESLGFVVNQSVNNILSNRRELDLVIEEKKLAIEYCGLYWHNEKRQGKTRHLEKLLEANSKGYRLITIFDDEWRDKPNIVKSKIKSALGLIDRIGARKCIVKEIDNDTSNTFLLEHHIQGPLISMKNRTNIGLFLNDDLVALSVFGVSRYNHKFDYELIRYCSKITVVGGLSKCIKYFGKKSQCRNLVSYCDLRWGTGNLYKHSGFKLSHISNPSYWYFNPSKLIRYHRSKFMKKKVIALGGDPSLTEYENMLKMGYRRIWDCGTQVWTYQFKT